MDDLVKFDGGWYPASGRYQTFPHKLLDKLDYRFQVTQVTKLPDDAEDRWWIDWPPGTIITDRVNEKNSQVPAKPMEEEAAS